MLGILALVCSIGAWACSIMVGVQAIKRKETVIGIICILPFCVIVGLIYGWIKANQWGIRNLMVVFTALFLLGIILNVVSGTATARLDVNTTP